MKNSLWNNRAIWKNELKVVSYSDVDLNMELLVFYSDGGLNNGVKVCYSNSVLNWM